MWAAEPSGEPLKATKLEREAILRGLKVKSRFTKRYAFSFTRVGIEIALNALAEVKRNNVSLTVSLSLASCTFSLRPVSSAL